MLDHRLRLIAPAMGFLLYCSLLPAAMGVELAPEDPIAQAGDSVLTILDVDAALFDIPKSRRMEVASNQTALLERLETMLIRRSLLEQGPINQHLNDSRVAELTSQTILEKLGERYLRHLLVELPKPDVEQAAKDHYLDNPDAYQTEERVSVTHILIGNERRSDEAALTLVTELSSQLKSDPGQFEALVRSHSDDPGVTSNGGTYADFARGTMVPPFSNWSFAATTVGQISDPVKTRFGYHLIRFDGRKAPNLKPYTEVQSEIVARLMRDYYEAERDRILAEHDSEPAQLGESAQAAGFGDDPALQRLLQHQAEEAVLAEYQKAYLTAVRPDSMATFAREYYLTHPSEFQFPERVTLDVVTLPADASEDASAQFKQISTALLAGEGSMLTDAENAETIRQDVRAVPVERLEPAVSEAVEALRESDRRFNLVVKDGHQYLIELITFHPAGLADFDDVQEQLVLRVSAERDKQQWEAHVDQFRNLPKSVNQEALAVLPERYANDEATDSSAVESPGAD